MDGMWIALLCACFANTLENIRQKCLQGAADTISSTVPAKRIIKATKIYGPKDKDELLLQRRQKHISSFTLSFEVQWKIIERGKCV